LKIAIVAAGSINCVRSIIVARLLSRGLEGAQLSLMDVNNRSLELVRDYPAFAYDVLGGRKAVSAATDLHEAVRGADSTLGIPHAHRSRIVHSDPKPRASATPRPLKPSPTTPSRPLPAAISSC